MNLASRMMNLGTETAFEVLAKARALEAQGKDIIHLEIGEPDFDTPKHIVEAGVDALRQGYTHYGPTPGLPELREDLIVAPLREVDLVNGLLFTRGPEFFVPEEGVEIFGPDNKPIGLEAIEVGNQVWLRAHQEGGVAVVERIKVAAEFEGPIFAGGGLEIISSFPHPGETGVPVRTMVEVGFNRQVGELFDDEDFDFGIFPEPLSSHWR